MLIANLSLPPAPLQLLPAGNDSAVQLSMARYKCVRGMKRLSLQINTN